jgi:glutamate synthase domain-containing protein 3
MNFAQESEPQVMYKTPKIQANSYNHLHNIHEKFTINHQLEKNTNMLNTNWTQYRTDFQKFLPHLRRIFH